MNKRSRLLWVPLTVLATASALSACGGGGYVTAKQLDRSKQGPASCESSCHDLGMRMAALVLVSSALPACVCQPLPVAPPGFTPAPAPAPAPAPQSVPQPAPPLAVPPPAPAPAAVNEGGSAAVGGFVAIAAAAAAANQQQRAHQPQSYPSHY